MKILYAIQGTGNGHINRARDIIPLLLEKGELDILVSGTEEDVELGYPVKYSLKGLCFVFGKNGEIDLLSTYKKIKMKRFYFEIKKLPVNDYDIIISDFEPVSSWSCRLQHKICFALSHQSAVLNKKSPHPNEIDPVRRLILKNYAPATIQYGFHFMKYDNKIFTPVIRREIRNARKSNGRHYTVYFPSYSDKRIIKVLSEIKDVEWQVFSRHSKKFYQEKNIFIFPISNKLFIKSMASSAGVLCEAGFEIPSEALFLRKKLMVISMKGPYEQQSNAAALKKMGVPVLNKLKLPNLANIKTWLKNGKVVQVDFPDITREVVDEIFKRNGTLTDNFQAVLGTVPYSFKKLKRGIVGNALHQIRK